MFIGLTINSFKDIEVEDFEFTYYTKNLIAPNTFCYEGFKGTYERLTRLKKNDSYFSTFYCKEVIEFTESSEAMGVIRPLSNSNVSSALDSIYFLGVLSDRFQHGYRVTVEEREGLLFFYNNKLIINNLV